MPPISLPRSMDFRIQQNAYRIHTVPGPTPIATPTPIPLPISLLYVYFYRGSYPIPYEYHGKHDNHTHAIVGCVRLRLCTKARHTTMNFLRAGYHTVPSSTAASHGGQGHRIKSRAW